MMPILREEVSLYPDRLLEESQPDAVHHWYVVYTRARHEKSLARHLFAHQISFYLPLVCKEQFIRGRRTRSLLPVFSGYLFYFGQNPDDIPRLAPYCVSCVLPVENQVQLQNELRSVQSLLVTGAPMTVEAHLVGGQRVRIKAGALRGLEGVIVQRKGGKRLLVAVHYLQQGVSIEIDDYMVEPIY